MRRSIAVIVCAVVAGLGSAIRADQEWRASALASFDEVWQTVNDTFHDPAALHSSTLDWHAVRIELRPKAEAAGSAEEVRRIIKEMLARLKRSHFQLLPAVATADEAVTGDAIVPIDVRVAPGPVPGWPAGPVLIVTRVDAAAARSGLNAGDVVSQIDRFAVSTALASLVAIEDPRARNLELWKKAARAMYGAEGSTAAITVGPPGSERIVRVPRSREQGELVKLGNLPPWHVRVSATEEKTPSRRRAGVIGFNIWMTAINDPVADAVDRFRKDDGLVIDLRGNPGGLAGMIRGIAGHVFSESVLLGTSQTRDAELEFKANPRAVTAAGRLVTPFAGPVAILVDELTGSASECFSAALQSLGRARVFGRQTMGQALPASTRKLPNGDVLLFAIGDFLTGTGRVVEADGVVPDEVVPLTPESFAGGRDPVLDAALRWIDRAADALRKKSSRPTPSPRVSSTAARTRAASSR
jgi:carboxyl-terminal processing protease